MSSKAYKPLAYRLWWSFVTMRILMILCILAPMFMVLNLVVLNLIITGTSSNHTSFGVGTIVDAKSPQVWTRGTLLNGFVAPRVMVVSPNTAMVRQVIGGMTKSSAYNATNVTYVDDDNAPLPPDPQEEERRPAQGEARNNSNHREDPPPAVRIIFSEASQQKLDYTLRFKFKKFMWPTSKKFGREADGSDLNFPKSHYFKYILPMQIALDESFLSTQNETLRDLSNNSNKNWEIATMPYPSHIHIMSSHIRLIILEVLLVVGIFPLVSRLASLTVQDKVSGINELLNMNGVPKWMFNISWLVCFGVITFVIAIVQMLFLQIPCDGTHTIVHFMDWFILLVVLVVYYWAALCSVAFLTTLITSPVLLLPILWSYWLLSFVGPFVLVLTHTSMSTVGMVFLALLPNGGLVLIFAAYTTFENASVVLTLINSFYWPEDGLPVGLTLIIMIFSIFLYYLLTVYMNSVRPGPYGTAMPWYLVRRKKPAPKPQTEDTPEEQATSPYFETVSSDTPTALKVTKLVKKFGSFTAVNNLNLSIVKNQITALLGHNGAGKSTFFNIISGLLSPTTGSVATEEYDIFEGGNITRFRQEIGYCPQHNFLLNDLSAHQHLLLFAMLKGMTRKEAQVQSETWANKFDIDPGNRKKRVGKLSGGMKRKVCLAMAMVSSPKYLLLDEPTSGLDPESRREIWDVLLRVRGTCTVIITTHFMEEADVLGDRIAIMAHGRLRCFGTSMFLKKKYGFGYKLHASVDSRESGLLKRVQKHVSSAETANETDRTIEIKLPASEVQNFPALFRELESDKKLDWTLANSTVDDIFLRVQEEEGEQIKVSDMPTTVEGKKVNCCTGIVQQIVGLIILKTKWTAKNWKIALFFVIIWPLFANILALLFSVMAERSYFSEKFPIVKLSFDTYQGSLAFMATKDKDVRGEKLQSAITSGGSTCEVIKPDESLEIKLEDFSKSDTLKYNTKVVFSFDTRAQPKAYFSNVAYHAAPIAYKALQDALSDKTIITYYHPYPAGESCKTWSEITLLLLWIFLPLGAALNIPHFCLTYPHNDRTTCFRHLQMITGIASPIYWLSLFIFDYMVYLLYTALTILCILLFDPTKLFSDPAVLTIIAIVLLLHGVGGMFIAYFCSFFFKRYNNAMELYSNVQMMGLISGIVLNFMKKGQIKYLYFLPWVVLGGSFVTIVDWTCHRHECDNCGPTYPDTGQPRKACQLIEGDPGLMADLKWEMLWFIIDAFLYLILIVCIDVGLWTMLMTKIKILIYGKIKEDEENIDPDVKIEKQRIRDIRSGDKGDAGETPVLISDGLGKKFKKRIAVHDVTFGMNKGECFGLLGPNGAGKSTTFGMLAGSVAPTKGNALIEDKLLSKNTFQYLKHVGYCPQLEGLLGDLSARVLIAHFMRLRRYPPSQIKSLTNKWVEALGMGEICERPCKTYSGGNKKKLSLVLALIGNPTVVFLDEPSTGVDVVIMRRMWEVLKHCLDTNQQTIVICSHSMTECEAVCGRLTVLASGVMQCIGTVPKLKLMFGTSRVIQVKLIQSCLDAQQDKIQAKIESTFAPNIQVQEKQKCFLSFQVHSEAAKLSDLFAAMISLKKQFPEIDDFSVEDASFEQVFLSFTKEQQEGKGKKSEQKKSQNPLDQNQISSQQSSKSAHVE